MVRIVFASDSHLNKHYARMTPDQLGRRRARLRDGWEATVDAAIEGGAHIYIHGGDLFDGPNPRSFELARAATGFRRLKEAGIVAITLGGNHDIPRTRGGDEAPQEILAATGLAEVFTRGMRWWTGSFEGTTVAIGGLAPDPGTPVDQDPLAAAEITPPPADLVLVITHYAIEGTLPDGAMEPVIGLDSIRALSGRVHALLVGHVHSAVGFDVDGIRVVFPGPTERMGFGETDVRPGYAVLEARGRPVRLTITRHRLDAQPMRRSAVSAAKIPFIEPTEWLQDVIRRISDPDQILQVRLEGAISREVFHELRFHELARLGQALNFYFDLDRHGLVVAEAASASVASAGRPSPANEIRQAARARMEGAGSDEQRLLQEAVEMALAAYGSGTLDER